MKLGLWGVRDHLSMTVLSNLTSLTRLDLRGCDNLTIHGFNPLMGLSLKKLVIIRCGSVAADLFAEVVATNQTLPAGSWRLERLEVDNIYAVLPSMNYTSGGVIRWWKDLAKIMRRCSSSLPSLNM
jgi:hypothetical protein